MNFLKFLQLNKPKYLKEGACVYKDHYLNCLVDLSVLSEDQADVLIKTIDSLGPEFEKNLFKLLTQNNQANQAVIADPSLADMSIDAQKATVIQSEVELPNSAFAPVTDIQNLMDGKVDPSTLTVQVKASETNTDNSNNSQQAPNSATSEQSEPSVNANDIVSTEDTENQAQTDNTKTDISTNNGQDNQPVYEPGLGLHDDTDDSYQNHPEYFNQNDSQDPPSLQKDVYVKSKFPRAEVGIKPRNLSDEAKAEYEEKQRLNEMRNFLMPQEKEGQYIPSKSSQIEDQKLMDSIDNAIEDSKAGLTDSEVPLTDDERDADLVELMQILIEEDHILYPEIYEKKEYLSDLLEKKLSGRGRALYRKVRNKYDRDPDQRIKLHDRAEMMRKRMSENAPLADLDSIKERIKQKQEALSENIIHKNDFTQVSTLANANADTSVNTATEEQGTTTNTASVSESVKDNVEVNSDEKIENTNTQTQNSDNQEAKSEEVEHSTTENTTASSEQDDTALVEEKTITSSNEDNSSEQVENSAQFQDDHQVTETGIDNAESDVTSAEDTQVNTEENNNVTASDTDVPNTEQNTDHEDDDYKPVNEYKKAQTEADVLNGLDDFLGEDPKSDASDNATTEDDTAENTDSTATATNNEDSKVEDSDTNKADTEDPTTTTDIPKAPENLTSQTSDNEKQTTESSEQTNSASNEDAEPKTFNKKDINKIQGLFGSSNSTAVSSSQADDDDDEEDPIGDDEYVKVVVPKNFLTVAEKMKGLMRKPYTIWIKYKDLQDYQNNGNALVFQARVELYRENFWTEDQLDDEDVDHASNQEQKSLIASAPTQSVDSVKVKSKASKKEVKEEISDLDPNAEV